MKRLKTLLSFLTIICCLAGSIAPAYAAGGETGVPTAVFTNAPRNSPDLYVTKEVESVADGYTAPSEDIFRFVLTDENDVPIQNQKYCIIDQDARVIYEYTGSYVTIGKEEVWNKKSRVDYTTGTTGIFTLRAGQTAWFQDFGVKRQYKVKEYDTYLSPQRGTDGSLKRDSEHAFCDEKGNFVRAIYQTEEKTFEAGGYSYQSPANGATPAAEVLTTGSTVKFANRYLPEGVGKKPVLKVRKQIDFLDGYTIPDTPDFWFSVELKGAPYANEVFTIEGAAAGEPTEGKTDAAGRFSLRGGQTAVFSDIPAGVDYNVCEILKEKTVNAKTGEETSEKEPPKEMPKGWWAIGETEKYGTTGNSLVEVNFKNTNVSFAVSKTLTTGEKPEVEFTFKLTDALGDAMGGKTFLRYLTTKKPVYQTDEETAVPDTSGEETEEPADTQSDDPASADTVDGTKPADSAAGEDADVQDTDTEGSDAKDEVFRAEGKVIETGVTKDDGTFTLKPGEVAIFVGMKPGTQYRVKELARDGYTQVQPSPADEDSIQGLYTVSDRESAQLIQYVNQPTAQAGRLTVTKTVKSDAQDTRTDDEFHFVLYRRLKTKEEVEKAFGQVDAGTNPTNILTVIDSRTDSKYVAVKSEGNTTGSTEDNYKYCPAGSNDYYTIYAAVENAIYAIPTGLENPNFATGPKSENGKQVLQPGEFILKAEQTAVFDKLKSDQEYLVRECAMTSEYTEQQDTDAYVSVPHGVKITETDGTSAIDTDAKAQYAQLGSDGAALLFTNQYTPKPFDLYLHKTDGSEVNPLAGAEFMLYLTQNKDYPVISKSKETTAPENPEGGDANTNPETSEPLPASSDSQGETAAANQAVTDQAQEVSEGNTADQATPSVQEIQMTPSDGITSTDGNLVIRNLRTGTYWLYELKAPSGYCILKEPIKLEITRTATTDGTDGDLQVLLNGRSLEDSQKYNNMVGNATTIIKAGADLPGGDSSSEPTKTENDTLYLVVKNTDLYELPNSGGSGIYWYTISGTLLMLAAVLILYRTNRQRRC